MNLYANYFKVESSPDWQMYQYHVDFNPPIDSRKMRKGMLYDHAQKLFKAHLFDGMMLFTNSKLDEVCHLFVLDLSNVCKTKPKTEQRNKTFSKANDVGCYLSVLSISAHLDNRTTKQALSMHTLSEMTYDRLAN